MIPTSTRAQGKWRGILLSIGIPERALNRRHGPCPLCGGTDRFRYDDKDARGTWICGQCGAGDGVMLVEKFKGISSKEALQMVDNILGTTRIAKDKPKPQMSPERQREAMRGVWRLTAHTQPGDVVDAYMAARGVSQGIYPASIRTAAALRYTDGTEHPAMVALMVDAKGDGCSLHRTFLAGTGKLPVSDCRKIMPGELPDGACVRLSDWNGGPLGVAEGIETAFAASRLFSIPVWATLNTALMQRFIPPEDCDEFVVFADNDRHFAGLKAAYTLANRVKIAGNIEDVRVMVPDTAGDDWNDVLLRR